MKRFPGRKALLTLSAFLVAVYLCSGFYKVPPESVGVVQRFGAYVRTTGSGLHWRLPRPLEKHTVVATLLSRVTSVGYRYVDRFRGRSATPDEKEWMTGDQNLLDVQMQVYYRVSDPKVYLFETQDPPQYLIRWLAESAETEILAKVDFDYAFTQQLWLAQQMKARTQRLLDRYRSGLTLQETKLEKVKAPDPVWDVFSRANEEKALIEKKVQEAERYAKQQKEEAERDYNETVAQATSYAQDKIEEATGTYQSFIRLLRESENSEPSTRRRLYLETLQEVLPKVRIISAGDDASMQFLIPE